MKTQILAVNHPESLLSHAFGHHGGIRFNNVTIPSPNIVITASNLQDSAVKYQLPRVPFRKLSC
jgi:hypothetical protein